MLKSVKKHGVGFAVGGCLETSVLPYHLLRLVGTYPNLSLAFAVSSHALDFVTPVTLEAIARRPIYIEERRFDPLTRKPFHLVLSEMDVLVIYPATARIIAEAALGIISCLVTRAFSFMAKNRVIVAPYLHPAMDQRLYEDHLSKLRQLDCRLVLPEEGLFWRKRSAWEATKRMLCASLGLEANQRPPALVQASETGTVTFPTT